MKEHEHIRLPQGSIEKTTTTLNLGPTHPATHGVFQNILELDGERIVSAEQTVGYIHRAFEKLAERRPLYQITPLTDRLNYCSAPINNMGWHLTCEKLLSIKTPKRVDYLRVIIMELARIADHLVCNSIVGVDAGAYTGFLYVMQYRELIYEIWEEVCGSRLTTTIGRIGGFERNFNDIAFQKLEKFLKEYPKVLKEFINLFERNRIFMDRTQNTGGISAERALNYGFTGPNLRAAGVDYDVRVHTPYSSYEDFDFHIPVGKTGDNYDRWQVRNEEMWSGAWKARSASTGREPPGRRSRDRCPWTWKAGSSSGWKSTPPRWRRSCRADASSSGTFGSGAASPACRARGRSTPRTRSGRT
jgi:NADH-quinone oxidoreductase subunit D